MGQVFFPTCVAILCMPAGLFPAWTGQEHIPRDPTHKLTVCSQDHTDPTPDVHFAGEHSRTGWRTSWKPGKSFIFGLTSAFLFLVLSALRFILSLSLPPKALLLRTSWTPDLLSLVHFRIESSQRDLTCSSPLVEAGIHNLNNPRHDWSDNSSVPIGPQRETHTR